MGSQENVSSIENFVDTVQRRLIPATTRAALVDCLCESFPAENGARLWIGELDTALETIRPRAAAGIDRDALEPVPLDGSTPSRVLFEKAIASRTVRYGRDHDGAPLEGIAPDAAGEVRSLAILPLVPDGTSARVIHIARSAPFDSADREALATLRETLERALQAFDPDETDGADRSPSADSLVSAAMNSVPLPFYVCDLDSTLRYWNGALEETTGYEPPALRTMSVADLFAPEDRDRLSAALERVRDGERAVVEGSLLTADGERTPTAVALVLVSDENGRPVGICGIERRLTDHTLREGQLPHHRDELAALQDHLLETVPTGVMMVDADGNFTEFNRRAVDVLELSDPDRSGSLSEVLDWAVTTPDGEPIPRAEYPHRRVLETGEPVFNEVIRLEHPEKDPIWLSINGQPLPDPVDGTAAVFAVEDITRQKQREQYLEDAKAQLEAATDAGAVGTWEWQIPDNSFVTGASFARTFGVDPEEARTGVPIEKLTSSIHVADRERVKAQIQEAVDSCGEYEEEYRVWNADGELRWVVARGHVECDEDGTARTFPGALADITDRKRAEEALRRHKDQLRTLIRLLPVGVVVADAGGRLVEANDAAREIWGGDVFDAESPADYDKFSAWEAETGEALSLEERPMIRVLDGEEITDPDILEIEAVDGSRRVIMVHGMPVRDAVGEVSRGVITITDITDRERREQQLQRQNNRLESFASMLAHELRNPLSIGKIYLPEAAAGNAEAAAEVEASLERIEKTIDMLLVLTRGSEFAVDPKPVSLEETAIEVWSNLAETDAHLETDTDLVLDVEPTHLTHILENLFRNAVEHGGEDPVVRVGSLEGGFYVEDTGPGIPEDEREQVFEAGYTTGTTGLGLGLTFVAQLAETYGWRCRITEGTDGGARIEFTGVEPVGAE